MLIDWEGVGVRGTLLGDYKDVVCVYTHTHTHTLVEYSSAIKRNEILPFSTTWMELDSIILSKISQSEKDKYHMISLICGI